MRSFTAKAVKCLFTWKPGNAPSIDPGNPVVEVTSGGLKILVRITPKNARKLQARKDCSGKIEGKLVLVEGRLELVEASAQMFDPPPPASEPDPAFLASPSPGPVPLNPPPLAGPVHRRAAPAV